MRRGRYQSVVIGLGLSLGLSITWDIAAAVPRERPAVPPDALQYALWLTGDYAGPADGMVVPKALHDALKAFRHREGLAATGEASPEELARIGRRARAAATALGLEPAIDAARDMIVVVPRALLPNASRIKDGRRFASADGTVVMTTFARPGGRPALAQLRDELAADRPDVSATLNAATLSMTAADRDTVVVARATEANGTIKGVSFSYPRAQATQFDRVARFVVAAFDAQPQAPRLPGAPQLAAFNRLIPVHAPAFASLDSDETQKSATISQGRLTVRLSLNKHPEDPARDAPRPVLEIKADGQTVASIDIKRAAEGWKQASVQIVALDPAAPFPAVVFSVSSGLTCCVGLQIAVPTQSGAWQILDAGPFRATPRVAADPLRPGGFVLAGELTVFQEVFAPADAATAPLTILRLQEEWLEDVTRDAAFRPMHAANLATNLAVAKAVGLRANAVWPGIVASARLLDEGDEASELMEKHHDPAARNGRLTCTARTPTATCPPDQVSLRPLAEAVDAVLAEAGFRR